MALSLAGACSRDEAPTVEHDQVIAPAPVADVPPPAPVTCAFEVPGLDALRPRPRFGWPVQSVHITSYFGWRVDPVSGRGTRLHRGLDFRGAIGDLVLTIGPGTIEFVGHDPLLGNMVIVDHGDGLESLYGHLSDLLVVAGVPVGRGAAIGLVGNSGRSTAPHLHLTVKLDGHAIDPLEVIGEPQHAPHALTPVVAEVSPGDSEGRDEAADGAGETGTADPIPVEEIVPRRALPQRSDDGGGP
ncbi:MAG: M23 family metallopeptidase [Myxococcota bacterium]